MFCIVCGSILLCDAPVGQITYAPVCGKYAEVVAVMPLPLRYKRVSMVAVIHRDISPKYYRNNCIRSS